MMWDNNHVTKSKHSRAYLVAVHCALGAVMAALFALSFGYVVMLLWNAVMPTVIAAHSITYWQSVGLLVLARILVGGIGRHGGEHGHGHRPRREAWREYDEWWRQAGKQSFETFAGSQDERKGK
jgi:hypothetical protein